MVGWSRWMMWFLLFGVPKIAGTKLVFKEDLKTEIQTFDLARIVKSAPRIESDLESKLSFAEPYGDPGNRVDILVMGDGYTSSQETCSMLISQHWRMVSITYNL